jgi:hypothetical protein
MLFLNCSHKTSGHFWLPQPVLQQRFEPLKILGAEQKSKAKCHSDVTKVLTAHYLQSNHSKKPFFNFRWCAKHTSTSPFVADEVPEWVFISFLLPFCQFTAYIKVAAGQICPFV